MPPIMPNYILPMTSCGPRISPNLRYRWHGVGPLPDTTSNLVMAPNFPQGSATDSFKLAHIGLKWPKHGIERDAANSFKMAQHHTTNYVKLAQHLLNYILLMTSWWPRISPNLQYRWHGVGPLPDTASNVTFLVLYDYLFLSCHMTLPPYLTVSCHLTPILGTNVPVLLLFSPLTYSDSYLPLSAYSGRTDSFWLLLSHYDSYVLFWDHLWLLLTPMIYCSPY